ncbi:Pilus biogenesis CpaD protein [compost metagenome]
MPGHRIQMVGYAAPDPRAPVLAGFETIRAAVPQCGTQWGNLGRTGDNQSSANFGCAVTANLAAQIADPRDIVAPRALAPADAGRRSVVFDAYRSGEQTAAQREALLTQTRISRAVE